MLYTTKNLQGSVTPVHNYICEVMLYTTKNLQGSVTVRGVRQTEPRLYTTKNLQGSVTFLYYILIISCYILLKIYRVL